MTLQIGAAVLTRSAYWGKFADDFFHYYGLREMVRLTNDGLLSERSFFEIGKELAKSGVALGINADEYR